MYPFPRPLRMADSSGAISHGAVIYQLAEVADRAGFTSPLWMSYRFALANKLTLRPKTVPLNIWHPLCGDNFFAAHPAHVDIHILNRDGASGSGAELQRRQVVSKAQDGQLEWTTICPSVAMFFSASHNGMASPTLWVPSLLTREVPVYVTCRITLPLFQTLVNYDQLEETAQLEKMLHNLYSES